MQTRDLSSLLIVASLISLTACGSTKIAKYNPFSESVVTEEKSRTPADSVEYQCENNRRFYLRTLDKGNAVWLIYPDREVNLDKTSGGTYSNGIAVLEINGENATLKDGPKVDYKECKAVTAKK